MNIPINHIYDATTETFVEAVTYTDQQGNLVAPPGYSFVQAEVLPVAPTFNTLPNYPHQQMPNMTFCSPNFSGYEMKNQYHGYAHSQSSRRNFVSRPNFNVKEVLVEQTFNAIKRGMEMQKLWVDIRQEDEGFHTVRVHVRKKQDVAQTPMILQKIVSEIGVAEVSMHFLKRRNTNKKFGLTLYIRCRKNNSDVLKTIQEFSKFKIHARRVRELPFQLQSKVKAPQLKQPSSLLILKKDETKFSKVKPVQKPTRSGSSYVEKQTIVKSTPARRDFADEDPVLEDSEEEIQFNRSRSSSSIAKPKRKKSTSRTISVLVPNHDQEEILELKFENGARKRIRMRMSSKSKSVSRIKAEKVLRSKASTGKVGKSWGSI